MTTMTDDYDSMTDADFRRMVADFIEAECPAEIRHLPRRIRWHEVKPWSEKLGKRVKTLMGKGATRRDISRALGCTDQTVTNLAFGRTKA